jgi:hypothetical protein
MKMVLRPSLLNDLTGHYIIHGQMRTSLRNFLINRVFDGEVNPSWTVPIERDRGVDVADVWQAQQESRSKLRNAHRLDIAKHGLTPKTESDG